MIPLCAGMTERFFCALEVKFGEVFFSHLAGYISATKYGLTEMELLDVMSCDQQVASHLPKLCLSIRWHINQLAAAAVLISHHITCSVPCIHIPLTLAVASPTPTFSCPLLPCR